MPRPTRRRFLGTTAALGLSGVAAPHVRAAGLKQSAQPLRVALIGVQNRGGAHHNWANRESIVALCDADTNQFHRVVGSQNNREGSQPAQRWPDAAQYQDVRELLDAPDTFDVAVISTPDHTHFLAAMRCLEAGKAVFCEKPLTWSPWEAMQLAATTARLRLPTQMGNQGMGGVGWRKCHGFYHRGLIGQVHTVHAWSPLQGNGYYGTAGLPFPEGEDAVPEGLSWDAWLGPAAERPFVNDRYHPAKWRQRVDFGGGILADWCCHKLNAVFKTLTPGYPTAVRNTDVVDWNGESWPTARVVQYSFPSDGERDAFELYWHDGNAKPTHDQLPHWPADRGIPDHGVVLVGERGSIHVTGSHNGNAELLGGDTPGALQAEFGDAPPLAERSRGHFDEFLQAARGDIPWNAPLSNFTFGGQMTAAALLGNVSLIQDRDLEVDPATGHITNLDDNDAALRRRTPRDGYAWTPA